MAGFETGEEYPVDSVASDDAAETGCPTFSFELYPPRNEEADAALQRALVPLVDAGPEFISVTYGAERLDPRSSRSTCCATS